MLFAFFSLLRTIPVVWKRGLVVMTDSEATLVSRANQALAWTGKES